MLNRYIVSAISKLYKLSSFKISDYCQVLKSYLVILRFY